MRVCCVFLVRWWPRPPRDHTAARVYLQPTTQQARRHAHCATRLTPTEDTSASEQRACACTCDDAYRHADDRRSTTDDGRRRPNVHTRMQATPPHHPNSQPARRRATPLHDRRPPKIRAPASAEHPQQFGRQSLHMALRSALPTSGEHEELARAPVPPNKRRVSDASRDKDRHSRRRNERRR